MTTPRGLTQPFTSFIGSACQGIHHAPLITNTQTTTHKHAGGHTSELDKKLIKEKRNHTNTHKQTTKAAYLVCLMLASTIQFSHNTPTTPCQHGQCQQDSWSGTKKGDNAPDTQQCTNIQTTLFLVQLCMDNVCHKAPFKHLVRLLSVCFTRTIFNNKSWQYDTRILNQPRVQLHPKNKSSLERR